MKARKHDPLAGSGRVVGTMKTKTAQSTATPNPTTGPNLVRVPFRDHDILAVKQDGGHWLPLRPLCERFGLSMQGQHLKLQKAEWAVVNEMLMTGSDGKTYQMTCISLDTLAAWLLSIKTGKVKPEVRDALVAYQKEAAGVLYRHFFGGAHVGPGLAKTSPVPTGPTTEQVIELVGKMMEPIIETQRSLAGVVAQIQAQVTALHRDHNAAADMASIGSRRANERVKRPITRLAREKAECFGDKKFVQRFNRKFHIRVREACGNFQGKWDRLPHGLLAAAESCIANMERDVRDDIEIAKRRGERPAQMSLDEARPNNSLKRVK